MQLETEHRLWKINIAGGGWRMPSINELRTLYQKGVGTCNITPLLTMQNNHCSVWTSATSGRDSATGFNLFRGETAYNQWGPLDYPYDFQAFAVRSRRQ